MTGDQKLISKIEQVDLKLEADEWLAAYHLLDEIVRELETSTQASLRAAPAIPSSILAPRERLSTARPPAVAAG